jgi:non-heme chloroperoxidase
MWPHCGASRPARWRKRLDVPCSARAAATFFLAGFTTDLREELRAISVPTLIIHGDHDAQAPIDVCGRKTAQLVPNNTFVVYPNAAHGLFVTHANRLNADLVAFARTEAIPTAMGSLDAHA